MDGSGGTPSLAELRVQRLRRDHAREIDATIASLDAHSGYSTSEIDRLLTGEGRAELIAAGGISPGLWEHVRQHLPSHPPPRRDIGRLCFCDIKYDQFSAVCTVEADDSGAVLVSDGLVGLLVHLSQMLSHSVDGLDLGRIATARMIMTALRNESGRLSKDQRTASALTRYHLIQQKVFGIPGKLPPVLSEAEEDFGASLFQLSLWFVLAHEAAHYWLGHPTSPLSVLAGERVTTVSDAVALELEADAMAMSMTIDGASSSIAPNAVVPAEAPALLAGLGAGLALLAVELTETAILVRRTRSHPPASERWATLMTRFGEPVAAADTLIGFLRAPLGQNAPPRAAISQRDWEKVFRSRRVRVAPFNASAVEYTPPLDLALHGPLYSPRVWSDLDAAVPAVASTFEQIAAGHDLDEALRSLGVSDDDVRDVMDPSVGQSFFGLLDLADSSEALASIENRELRRLIAILFARAVSERLPSE